MGLARPKTKAQQAETTSATHVVSGSITLGDALDRWYTHLAASDRIGSQRTIDAYRYGVTKLVERLGADYPLHSVTAEDIEGLMANLKARRQSAGGRAVVYRPLRTFFRWAVERGLAATSPVERVAAPKAPAQPVVFVTDAEWSAILATTRSKSRWAFRSRRDRAILLMLATTGARLSEGWPSFEFKTLTSSRARSASGARVARTGSCRFFRRRLRSTFAHPEVEPLLHVLEQLQVDDLEQ